ncbi:NtaA/DmoA family FMN-dependent monooxygenase [Agrobacterium genomosp. 3]|uniref:NtaA/DmoA family FMN-dependent monooxygenase n=1 Tax=Agrobacterium tomkonis TaxID=1183410 RepID=UPI001CD90F86|nr:NtaA/DmoA family FMN-dependent monooxygenase [Agrobacterium tomkonis]MCA1875520.1 NtaA/DmoA family FMN-dependent monooxygenase [Agrobacterium tumefaciens]MCA1891532.1 NtaA/DmoA family FMN-dependent monooxygenase [Agrobacterium tomkonis]
MSVAAKLHVGMSLAPTWLSGEAWRRADSDIGGVFSSDYFVDLAQRAEAAYVDFVFRPDTLFLRTEGLETGGGFASMDPTMLLAAIARETSRVGLLSTVSTTFLPPYVVARQIQSLNWLSNGRAGWNIVTALEGHENFGLKQMPSPQGRYERAAEFTQVVRQLWASFPNEALKLDRESGRFADSSLVRPVAHEGPHFSVKGPLNLPAHASRIPLVQAGASPEGRDFASSVADAVFASTPDMQAAIELRADLRRRAEGHGRRADEVKLMPGLSLYLASSRKEALELFAETHARANRARAFASIRDMTGLDLSEWPLTRIVTASDLPLPPETPRSRTHANLLRRLIERETLSVADLLQRPEVMGSGHWQIIGTVEDAFETIREWAQASAIDGFVAVPGGSVASMRLVLEQLLPRLGDAGLFRTGYSGHTFADHLAE